ncbi:hypothetical protein Q7P36_005521 [Cladosporium allicinum]
MTLTDAQRCQICGDSLFDDDFFSDPSQHFCLSENGPSMTAKSQVNSSDQINKEAPQSTEPTCRKLSLRAVDSERPTKMRRVLETCRQVGIEGM